MTFNTNEQQQIRAAIGVLVDRVRSTPELDQLVARNNLSAAEPPAKRRGVRPIGSV